MPVVGMVGGGQLARMTAAAAIGLGTTFRVLSESESESAALVTHDVTIGSHLSFPDISAFAAECDVVVVRTIWHAPNGALQAPISETVSDRVGDAREIEVSRDQSRRHVRAGLIVCHAHWLR